MRDLGRVDGHHPGVALTEKRAQFVALIRQGVGNSEACALVGVNRKTGTRWRYGRIIRNTVGEPVHYPAVMIKPASPRSSRYLSLDERTEIADLRRERCGVQEIARRIGRAASTVSREVTPGHCLAKSGALSSTGALRDGAVDRRDEPPGRCQGKAVVRPVDRGGRPWPRLL